MEERHIVIFDGICNFCNGAVNFIIKRDPIGKFKFTPMQSELSQSWYQLKRSVIGSLGYQTWDKEGILYAELDLNEITRAKIDFDVIGHYARPDVFQFNVNTEPQPPIAFNND